MGLSSNNPILANITDYLIEEASAEEEELLGKNNDLEDGEEGEEGNSVTRLVQGQARGLSSSLSLVSQMPTLSQSRHKNAYRKNDTCWLECRQDY